MKTPLSRVLGCICVAPGRVFSALGGALGALGCVWACASTPTLEGPAPALAPPPATAQALDPTLPPAGKLFREDVVSAVDAGMPAFLQKVQVEASVRDGKFVGWIIRGLFPSGFWQGVDLQPGDVVTAVNGKPVERDTEAYDTFVALKTAPRLEVSYLRGTQARQLSYEIVPRPR